MNFFGKIFGTNKKLPSSMEKNSEIERFSSTGRESLEKLGYTIYTLQGMSLATLHAKTGQPVLEASQLQEFIDGEWVKLRAPGDFWYEVSLATEVAINPKSPILPESADKGYKTHQRMAAEFSDVISKEVPGASAIIGTASYYIELALIHRRATGKPLFEDDVRLVTRSEYIRSVTGSIYKQRAGDYLVQVGQSKGGLYCWEYWLETYGRPDVWLMPLVVPQGIR